MKKKLAKMLLLLAAVILSVAPLAACTSCGEDGETKNSDTFVYLSSWTREGVGSHMNSGTNIGPLDYFAVEGLARYVRISNEIVYQLAESFEHKAPNEKGEAVTTVKLKANAKWHNGDDFTAEDVRGYYILNHATLTEYIYDIVAVDAKTVDFYWRPSVEPSDQIKTLLLSQDKAGGVSYKVFKEYVDKCWQIIGECEPAADGELSPFGKKITGASLSKYTSNFQDYRNKTTDWFVATGPYKLSKISSSQMLLERNENYHGVANVGFKTIKAINGVNDLNTVYSQLEAGNIDYQDGTPAKDVLERIITRNKSMVHYKIYDPGSIGILFNLDKPIWTDNVRLAFQYLFDREQIKNVSNYYAKTSYYPMMSMAPTETKQFMSESGLKYLDDNFIYSYNKAKAEELLKAEGWTKSGDRWHVNGQPVELLLGYDGSNSYFRSAAEAAVAQLNAFGITTQQKRHGDWGVFYSNATDKSTKIDLSVCWTDLNMTMPYGSVQYAYDGPVGDLCHIPRYAAGEAGFDKYNARVKLTLAGVGGNEFEAASVYPKLYSIKDAGALAGAVDDLVVGMARKNYGVQFFQNVTGAFWNIDKVAGLPHEEQVRAERNYMFIPTEGKEFNDWAKINVLYSFGTVLTDGTLKPRG